VSGTIDSTGQFATLATRVRDARPEDGRPEEGVTAASGFAHSKRQFATLAARVRDTRPEGGTIAVTASLFAEGASTVALGLALSLEALIRETVLLIDANWLDSTLTRGAHAADDPGLTDCLRRTSSFGNALLPTKQLRLVFMPVGTSAAEGAPLGVLGAVIEEARKRFRYVVADLPPVLAAQDVVLPWRSASDEILVVVRTDATPIALVRRALDEIGLDGTSQLVANRTKAASDGFHLPGTPTRR
jgi:Mrp family chromosome partitioning ATPase